MVFRMIESNMDSIETITKVFCFFLLQLRMDVEINTVKSGYQQLDSFKDSRKPLEKKRSKEQEIIGKF